MRLPSRSPPTGESDAECSDTPSSFVSPEVSPITTGIMHTGSASGSLCLAHAEAPCAEISRSRIFPGKKNRRSHGTGQAHAQNAFPITSVTNTVTLKHSAPCSVTCRAPRNDSSAPTGQSAATEPMPSALSVPVPVPNANESTVKPTTSANATQPRIRPAFTAHRLSPKRPGPSRLSRDAKTHRSIRSLPRGTRSRMRRIHCTPVRQPREESALRPRSTRHTSMQARKLRTARKRLRPQRRARFCRIARQTPPARPSGRPRCTCRRNRMRRV